MKDDDVGYKKPPKKSQFKKGQSGCPDGGHASRRARREERSAKQRDEAAALSEAIVRCFGEKKRVVVAGKQMEMSMLQASLYQLRQDAFNGDPQARRLWFEIAQKMGG